MYLVLQDNELTLTDYSGFVLAVSGHKVVTDVKANDGTWNNICVTWNSGNTGAFTWSKLYIPSSIFMN